MASVKKSTTRSSILFLLACTDAGLVADSAAKLLHVPLVTLTSVLGELGREGIAVEKDGQWRLGDSSKGVALPSDPAVFGTGPGNEVLAALAQCVRGDVCEGVRSLLQKTRRYAYKDARVAALCLDLVFGTMSRLALENLPEADWRRILPLIIEIADVSTCFYHKSRDACPLLDRALDEGRRQGDSRSVAVLRIVKAHLLTFAKFTMTAEADELFQSGFKLGQSFGDEDMLDYVSTFLGFRHFLRGEFPETVRHLDFVRRGFSHPYTIYWWALFYAMSSCFVGLDRQAVGLLESSWRSAERGGEELAAAVWRLHLAVLLLMAGKDKDALGHLEAVRQASKGDMLPFVAMRFFWISAYYYERSGDLEKSHAMLLRSERVILEGGFGHPTYHFPWMLPMLYEYHKAGLPDGEVFGFESELKRGLSDTSLQLRASALRIKGLMLLDGGGRAGESRACLKTALKFTLRLGNPVEAARVKLDLARADMLTGRHAAADRLRDAAFAVYRDYGQPSWPEGLPRPHVVRAHFSASRAPFGYINRESTFSFQPKTPKDLYRNLLITLCRRLRVEQGGLFRLEKGGLRCLAHFNLSERQMEDAAFSPLKTWLGKGIGTTTITRREAGSGCAVRIPISSGRDSLVIYLASTYFARDLDALSNAVLQEEAESLRGKLWMVKSLSAEPQGTASGGNGVDLAVIPEATPGALLTRNPAMLRLVQKKVKRIAVTDASVLISGETGVGKELLARQIHRNSGRKGLFVSVHPASMTETLFESAFFGHEKGSFTGATSQKIGFFELANHGTLFIDEVGEMPLSMQTKFLRVLQEHTFIRVGGLREIHSDFRLVAATNRDLGKEVAAGCFRQDLYYRLSVVPIAVPPLRMRGGDSVFLAQHFLALYARKYRRRNVSLSGADLRKIAAYPWPGNVRELENVIERAVILAGEGPLELSLDVPGRLDPPPQEEAAELSPPRIMSDWPSIAELERRYIKLVLERTGGRVYGEDGAEGILGIGRSTLYAKIRRYGLKAHRHYD